MAEYIKREDALDAVLFSLVGTGHQSQAIYAIRDVPAADVAEVEHGYWVDKPTGRYCHIGSYCSVCEEKSGIGGIESNRHKPYCPNCGARMDGTPKERGGEK